MTRSRICLGWIAFTKLDDSMENHAANTQFDETKEDIETKKAEKVEKDVEIEPTHWMFKGEPWIENWPDSHAMPFDVAG